MGRARLFLTVPSMDRICDVAPLSDTTWECGTLFSRRNARRSSYLVRREVGIDLAYHNYQDVTECQALEAAPPTALAALPMPAPDPMLMARLLEIPRTSFLAPVPLPVARQRNAPPRMATLSMAASAAAVVTLGAGWFLGGSSGGGSGPAVVPATPAVAARHRSHSG